MATKATPPFRSIVGKDFGMGASGEPVCRGDGTPVPFANNAVDAVIAVAASQTSPRVVTVQINNPDGTPIAHCQQFDMGVYLDAAGVAQAVTGGSTGMAVDGTAGIIEVTALAKKSFKCRTNAAGLWSGTWTDSAHEVAFLGVTLPSGRTVFSAALTTA